MFLSIQVQFTDPHLNPSNRHVKSQGSQSSSSIEDINPNINFNLRETPPFQEGVMSETFQRPDKSFFKNLKNWGPNK